MFGIISLAAFWLIMMWLLEKGIGKVRTNMGLEDPFLSIKARMAQGKSLPEAIIESGIDRFRFGWCCFIWAAKKMLPFGKKPGEWSFGKYMAYENSRIENAQKMADDYGGNVSDYL